MFCIPAENHIHIISFRKGNFCEQKKLNPEINSIDWQAVDSALLADAPDDDSPELSTVERTELRLLADVFPQLGVGKQRITIMLDEAVINAYKAKAGGRGYQTLINDTLRRALDADSLKDALREVIREELRSV